MENIKCITFDKEAQDNLPQEIKDRIRIDRERAEREQGAKFTPGPWIPQTMEKLDGDNLRVTTACEWEWEICHLCDGINGNIGETMEANARLIAAAPDMYKALQELVDIANVTWKERTTKETAAIIKANKALAKARGENQP